MNLQLHYSFFGLFSMKECRTIPQIGVMCYLSLNQASARGFSLIQNHPFVNGNRRIGHAATETFLVLNGFEINASVDEQEQVVSSEMKRAVFTDWLHARVVPITGGASA